MNSSLEAHRLLQELRNKSITSLGFPTHFDVAIRLREALEDDRTSNRNIIAILQKDAIVAASIIKASNTAQYGSTTLNLNTAINRLGYDRIRQIVLSVTAQQLAGHHSLLSFSDLSRVVWLNSIYSASAGYILAEQSVSVPANDTFFTMLIVNLGAFFMLHQASKYESLRSNKNDVMDAVREDYLSRTVEIVRYMKLPMDVVHRIQSLKQGPYVFDRPTTADEVVHTAQSLGRARYSWLPMVQEIANIEARLAHIVPEVDRYFESIRTNYTK